MKRKFLLVGLILAMTLIGAGANAQTNIVTNGNFEGGFTPDGTGDQIPNGWTKLETSEPPENSTIWWANDNGPTLAGSKSLDWVRWNGGMSGDWSACEQILNYNVTACATLTLTIDVKAFSHNLGGSGWTPEDWEYPVTIVVYYTDTQGIQRYWQWGWYLWIDQQTGPRPDHKQVSGNGVVTGQQIPQANVWVANSYNLLTELINPATINKIRVGGSGWDFEGRADNVQILCAKGWYWKPSYEDYAPNGMPDFDQKQDNWKNPGSGKWSFCGPTALANCWWWFDSKYNVPAGVPGDAKDRFPLVRDYLDALAARVGRDDHDPWNVNHAGTAWFPGGAPPATSQPFIPGAQTPGGGLTAWGELLERLAWYVDCDGRRTGNVIAGTNVDSMQAGIDRWLLSETFSDGTTLANILYERTIQKPSFAQVESLVEKSEDVILLLGFWYYGAGEQQFIRGDVDENMVVNMSDYYRCVDGPTFSCDDAADVNDDGVWNTFDCDYLYNFLMMGGPPPPPPFPACGLDPTPDQLGCAHHPCPLTPSQWYRVGGHFVTVAGVCSDSLKIAFSDPCFDWAEQGYPGRIGSGTIIPHPYPHTDSTIHNDAGNVSQDIYAVTLTSPSPGGLWGIPDYPASLYPSNWMNTFQGQSVPSEFLSKTKPWNGIDPVSTEVEYAVVISPRNRPPQIIQPDTLHGYTVRDTVRYTFDGIDPDGDVINDTASLSIVPSCGSSYSVQRISGQGTSTGTWQVTWLTAGCQGSITYKVIVDLKDAFNNTSYCTTYVPLAKRECDSNDPNNCDTLWVKCGNMRVPPGGGLVTVNLTIANDESLMVIVVPLSYKGNPAGCDSMPNSENTVAKVFAGSVVPSGWTKVVTINHQAKTVILAALSTTGPPSTDCLPPGKGHLGTLTLLGDSCCTILLDTTFVPPTNHVEFMRCNDPAQTLFYPVCRIDTCHIDRNHLPVITQPDTLSAFVGDLVSYTISGTDPDGDVIQDQASINIIPACGSYSITRISGQGTSTGTWQVSWQTNGCSPDTYMVIHDLTDVLGATAYCTTYVYLRQQAGWYWKPPYPDYAPSGMPDFDEKQDNWKKLETGQYTFCGPAAVANCFWWFDSKYDVPPGAPGDGIDMFPLVRDYMDNNPPLMGGLWDDHDPWNVDHVATLWTPPVIPIFPPTPPFVPGPQLQPSGMPPWGELVERLAWLFDTDGIQTGYCQHSGTNVAQMYQGIQMWLSSEPFLMDTFCVVMQAKPTFAHVESLVEKSEDVILLLGFWFEDPAGSGDWYRCGGHYVTVAGVNSQESQIAFSDPYFDAAEMGMPGQVGNGMIIPHLPGHPAPTHNDAGNVSHDIYSVMSPSPSPGGVWALPDYPGDCYDFNHQNFPEEFLQKYRTWNGVSPVFTEAEYAIHISPWDYRGDVNIPYGNGVVDIGDVVFLLNYLFKHGSAPVPFIEGDTNCDGVIDVGDVVILINYLFKHGAFPKCCDP